MPTSTYSSATGWQVVLRDFLLAQPSITSLVDTCIFYANLYSIHENVKRFPMITISLDTGNSYLGLASTFDIFIYAHSEITFFEAHDILQTVTDIVDPGINWLGNSFSIRGISNPTEDYDVPSRLYTVRKRFRLNLVGA